MSSAMYDKTLLHERESRSLDAIGGTLSTWGTVSGHESVACAVWPASVSTVREFGREDMLAEYEIATEVDLGSALGDRLTIGGKIFNVLGYKPFSNVNMGPEVFVTVCGKRNQ